MANDPKPTQHRVELLFGMMPPYKFPPYLSIMQSHDCVSYASTDNRNIVVYLDNEGLERFKDEVLPDVKQYASQENVKFLIIHSPVSITTVHP